MAFYRHRPTGTTASWVGFSGFLVFLLVLPAILNVVVPEVEPVKEPILLGYKDEEWEIQLKDFDSQPIECAEAVSETFTKRWECDNFALDTTVIESGEQPSRTLWRAIRGYSTHTAPTNGDMYRSGNVRFMDNFDQANQTAITLTGHGQHDGNAILVLISGEDRDDVVNLVLSTLLKEDAALEGKKLSLDEVDPDSFQEITSDWSAA